MEGLIVHSREPFNAEPAPEQLAVSTLTPSEQFYVRCHGGVPDIAESEFTLAVIEYGGATRRWNLRELKAAFPHRTVAATLQCAGNRRAGLQDVRLTLGDPWGAGAIGTAEWTGVRLADVLRASGAALRPGQHAGFACADEVRQPGETPFKFGVSVPAEKAMADEVLLAWAMNNEALAPQHGAPLRLVVPGWAGIRSAKWVCAVSVLDAPSNNPMQARDYKLLPPDASEGNANWARAETIEAMPLTSAICAPQDGARLRAGRQQLRGYAMACGRGVRRVEVSADDGRSWVEAVLTRDVGAVWTWTLWRAEVDLTPGNAVLVVRAWDEDGRTQPGDPAEVWNFKGYLNTAWHRLRVTVAD